MKVSAEDGRMITDAFSVEFSAAQNVSDGI
jgi:hypothetical protein